MPRKRFGIGFARRGGGAAVPVMPTTNLFASLLASDGSLGIVTTLPNAGSAGGSWAVPAFGTSVVGPDVVDVIGTKWLNFRAASNDCLSLLCNPNHAALSLFVRLKTHTALADYDPPFITGSTSAHTRLCTKLSTAKWGTYGGADKPATTTLSVSTEYTLGMVFGSGTGTFYLNGVADGTFNATGGTGDLAAANGLYVAGETNGTVFSRAWKGMIRRLYYYDAKLSGAALTQALAAI